jgi:hypothetical protein
LSYTYDELDHLKIAKRGSVGSTDITTTLNYDNGGRKGEVLLAGEKNQTGD